MIVEIKSSATILDIEKHIERLRIIKNHSTRFSGDTKLYGAIASALINQDVIDAIFRAGFFLISHQGDNVILIPPPEN